MVLFGKIGVVLPIALIAIFTCGGAEIPKFPPPPQGYTNISTVIDALRGYGHFICTHTESEPKYCTNDDISMVQISLFCKGKAADFVKIIGNADCVNKVCHIEVEMKDLNLRTVLNIYSETKDNAPFDCTLYKKI
ncbi:uncharacterized protein LOC103509116 [Diaphorina citri]|uniref:Uncharacterized protein LOC103509116 n=1 Tax=Diaphorina citri TaxID=121845 RepID=A0A1S3D2B9_DIACI|nr:uncharacterized protein LOC103509116 [Diaphorina citri]KAI5722997.1 hypothetical protein M8J76_016766 [Diaphorina citri]